MISPIASNGKLTRIGIFYDGNYFYHVSNYYLYHHERKARINIKGLHQFLIAEVAKAENSITRHCRIVDAHYFRGRLSAHEAKDRGVVFKERVFDEILMREGVVTHYLPLSPSGEKGIDVWLALEAFELTIYKRFDVIILVAADGDYLPLIRKMNTLGTRVMVLGWDFSYIDHNDNKRETRTSQAILDEATYPILMHTVIDDRSRQKDPLIENMFMKETHVSAKKNESIIDTDFKPGIVDNLKDGYGFIKPSDGTNNLFFHYSEVIDCDFNDLAEGDKVTYKIGKNEKGPCATCVSKVS